MNAFVSAEVVFLNFFLRVCTFEVYQRRQDLPYDMPTIQMEWNLHSVYLEII